MTLSKGVRLAYIRRQLRRLEEEHVRVEQMIKVGQLPDPVGPRVLRALEDQQTELRNELLQLGKQQ